MQPSRKTLWCVIGSVFTVALAYKLIGLSYFVVTLHTERETARKAPAHILEARPFTRQTMTLKMAAYTLKKCRALLPCSS